MRIKDLKRGQHVRITYNDTDIITDGIVSAVTVPGDNDPEQWSVDIGRVMIGEQSDDIKSIELVYEK